MMWQEGQIDGVVVRPLKRHEDRRGWLCELVRDDELPEAAHPAMAYVSATRPGVQRGPHEHREQTDVFAFVGPGELLVRLWDARPGSPTHGRRLSLRAGAAAPLLVIVPPGVVHAYRNTGAEDAWVLNFPNRLYAGRGKKEPVDEIRHEEAEGHAYGMEE